MKIKILYEDSNILAIDKPSGISVHADGSSKEKTIADWILKNYPKMEDVGEPIFTKASPSLKNEGLAFVELKKPGIVHRLDRETSGVLLLAKNKKAYQFLKNQFKNREVKKTYVAIVSGFVKNDHGIINKMIGRSPKDFRRHLSGHGARGEMREAITEYKVLKRFEVSAKQSLKVSPQKFTYLEIHPKTGRTHQIRVHMKYLNHPVVCDSLYNPNGYCPKSISRLALHAKSIEFKNLKGKILKVESPLPSEFKRVVK